MYVAIVTCSHCLILFSPFQLCRIQASWSRTNVKDLVDQASVYLLILVQMVTVKMADVDQNLLNVETITPVNSPR